MDRNAPLSIVTAVIVSVIGVFALMTMPMAIGVYVEILGFTLKQGNQIAAAEVAGGALMSILAVFWINKVNWRYAITFALICVIGGNVLTVMQNDVLIITAIRFAVGFLGLGTAFAIGISMVGNTTDHDRNFGFVISGQVAFGVITLVTLRPLVNSYDSIGGMYLPLAALAAIAFAFVRFVPAGSAKTGHEVSEQANSSLALPITGLLALLIWCCGLGAIWMFVERIAVSGGLESVVALRAIAISTTVAIFGALAAAALASKDIGRFLPVTIALLVQMTIAWFIQGQMNWVELAIKASVFQIFWNLTGPFMMGAISASDTGGKVAVLIPAAQTSGFFIGPTIAGQFVAESGLSAANVTAIVCCGIALLIFIPLSARLKAAGL